MRNGIICKIWLIVILTGLTGCGKMKSDKRVVDFVQYIVEQSEKSAISRSTEEEKINFITSRYNHGKEFDEWIEDIKKSRDKTLDDLYNYGKVIHQLDNAAGKELLFEEAVKIVQAYPDSSPNPDDEVWLKRSIVAIYYYNYVLYGWEEASKWEKKMKKEGKEIKLNQELLYNN